LTIDGLQTKVLPLFEQILYTPQYKLKIHVHFYYLIMKKNFSDFLRIDKFLPLFSNKTKAATPPQYIAHFWHSQQLKMAILVVGCLVGMVYESFAASRFAVANGDWNSTATWSATSGGASGASVPVAADAVTITGFTVTVSDTRACASLTLGASGVLTNNSSLTISGSIGVVSSLSGGTLTQGANATLTIGGSWNATTIYATLDATASGNSVVYNGAGNQTMKGTTYTSLTISASAGTKSFNGGATIINSDFTIPSGVSLTTNSQAITFNGDYIFSGVTPTFGSSAITIGGNKTAQSISGFTTTGNISMTKTAGTATFTGNVQGASLTINGVGGTLDLGTGLTHTMTITTSGNNGLVRTAGTLNGGSSTLKLAGNGSGSGATFNAGTGTVEYNSVDATTQTIATMTYNNLILTGANTKALSGAATVNGNFTINTGATLAHSSTSVLTLKGNFTNSGTYTATNTANVTFGGTTAQSISGTTPTFIGLTVGSTATLNLTAAQTVTTLAVNSGGILTTTATVTCSGTATINGTFQLNAGGWATGAGTWSYSSTTGTLVFNNTSSYGVNSGDVFWPTTNSPYNVTILQGGLTLNSGANRTVAGLFQTAAAVSLSSAGLTLNGTCQINTGGSFVNTPIYGASSTLIYNVGTYGVGNEWTGNSTTAGAGIPFNVTVQSGNITLPNSDRGAAGSVTISAGSLILNGTSGDLYVARNWTRAAAATFTPSNRAVFFVGGNAKTLTVTGGGTETFNYLRLGGSNTLQLTTGTNLAVNASSGTSLILSSSNSTSTIDLNGQTLTISGGGNMDLSAGTRRITSTLTGGTFIISSNNLSLTSGGILVLGDNVTTQLNAGLSFSTNQVTIGGGTSGVLQINSGGFASTPTYAAGSTLVYNNASGYSVSNEWIAGTSTGSGVPNNVTVLQGTVTLPNTARTVPSTLTMTSGAVTLTNGGDLTVTSLVLNNSQITTNAAKVIIPASGTLTRGTGYVVGYLQKNIATGATTRTFEVGDATNYTPLSISFGNVTVAGDLTANVTAAAHSNRGTSTLSSTKYVARYWTVTNSGVTFNNYAATFTYVSGDIQGSASTSALLVGKYDATTWTYPAVASTSSTSVTTTSSMTAFSDFFLAETGCINPTAFTFTGGGAYCSGGTGVAIGLSNSETGVSYQLILSAANDGSSVSGTNSAISFGLRTAVGTYTVLGTRTSGGCSTTMTGNAVVTINPLPTITLGINPSVCRGITAANLSYSATTNSPNQYSITYNAAAITAGFASVSGVTLPTTPIVLTVPAAATAATYNATLTVTNSTTGCVSAASNITATVNALPTIAVAQVNDLCQVSAGSITVTITGGAPTYSIAACGTTISPSPTVGTYIPITGTTVSSSGGSATFSNLQGNATYKLAVTDSNGCIGQ
jgi:hypothetical protein